MTSTSHFETRSPPMFAKKKDTPAPIALAPLEAPRAPAPAAAPAPRPKPASMIAQGVAIKGDVMGDGELHLDCVVQGDIRVGKLVLGPNARVEGSLHAQVIEIHGRVTGWSRPSRCAFTGRPWSTATSPTSSWPWRAAPSSRAAA
jgi:hypothetical protein